MNRTHDLRKSLPVIVKTANASPPVEIVVVNYSSSDDLGAYLVEAQRALPLVEGNFWTIARLEGRQYYNSAHARNLCVMASRGEYIIQLASDVLPSEEFVSYIRSRIDIAYPLWMCEGFTGCLIVCQRAEFIASGGYDERFSLYAPEDKDICARLHRRGGKFARFPPGLIQGIPTKYRDKLKNLDLRKFQGMRQVKREMSHIMRPIYEDNNAQGILVANPDGWGKWQ